MKQTILDHIPKGEQNAISAEELSVRTNKEKRVNRQAILNMRKHGIPICSTDKGYFLPETETETRAYIHSQLSRLASGYAALRPFRALIKREQERYAGQLSVSDFLNEEEKSAVGATNADSGEENL